MIRRAAFLAALAFAFPARAQTPPAQVVGPAPGTPLGYQQITSLSSSTALTVPASANVACIIPETQPVRYRDDGVAPTASVGMPLAAGVYLCVKAFGSQAPLTALRFIEQSASAKLNVSYYRQ